MPTPPPTHPPSTPQPAARQRRLRAWRRALRRPDLPAPAVLVLTERILALQRAAEPPQASHYTL